MLNLDWECKKVPKGPDSNLPMLRKFCNELRAIGKTVILIAPEPEFDEKTPMRYFRYLRRNKMSSTDKIYPKCVRTEKSYWKYNEKIVSFMKLMEKDKICTVLYPHRYLKKNGIYTMEIGGKLIFKDNHHFSIEGSEYIVRLMWKKFYEALMTRNSK